MKNTSRGTYLLAGIVALAALTSIAWQSGYTAGQESVSPAGSGAAGTNASAEVTSLLAKVQSVSGTTLSVIPLMLDSKASLTVRTDADTVYERMVPKARTVFLSEMDAYQKKMKQGAASSTSLGPPPIPFKTESITFDDIRAGDAVFITTEKDILKERSVSATRIVIQSALPYARQTAPESN